MRKVLQLALVDLRRTVRDRASFIWMLALPVALIPPASRELPMASQPPLPLLAPGSKRAR